MKAVPLNGQWSLRGREQDALHSPELTLTATVPGCVQLDLGILYSDIHHAYMAGDHYR